MMKANMIIPETYSSPLDIRKTEKAIKFIKDGFETILANDLRPERISAPIVVLGKTGINDNLTDREKPIRFSVSAMNEEAEIVQLLTKWKRAALADYGFGHGEGIYTDKNAIRLDENLDNLHSVYVDLWDWERILRRDERNVDFLKHIV
jgi:aspartate--ammonia ligase